MFLLSPLSSLICALFDSHHALVSCIDFSLLTISPFSLLLYIILSLPLSQSYPFFSCLAFSLYPSSLSHPCSFILTPFSTLSLQAFYPFSKFSLLPSISCALTPTMPSPPSISHFSPSLLFRSLFPFTRSFFNSLSLFPPLLSPIFGQSLPPTNIFHSHPLSLSIYISLFLSLSLSHYLWRRLPYMKEALVTKKKSL